MEAIQLFCLAEKYGVRQLKELLVSLVFKAAHDRSLTSMKPPSIGNLLFLYEHTSDNSGFRRLYVDYWVWIIKLEYLRQEEVKEQLCTQPQLAVDLMAELTKRVNDHHAKSPFKRCQASDYFDKVDQASHSAVE